MESAIWEIRLRRDDREEFADADQMFDCGFVPREKIGPRGVEQVLVFPGTQGARALTPIFDEHFER
jgi:hypothetical protein